MIENAEDLIRELNYVSEKYKNEKLCTFEVSRKRMAEDCLKIVTELQQENEQLKQQAESDQLALNESKEIIAELKAKLDEYVNIVEDDEVKCVKLQEEIKELEEQIEKMKCLLKEYNIDYKEM